jgi:hypothetical protein
MDYKSCLHRCGAHVHGTILVRCTPYSKQTLADQADKVASTRRCLSFFLGGKVSSDPEKGWAPNISAVRATEKYAIATERLKWEPTRYSEDITGSYRPE